jgi:predicted TPR repeat methyltransferase
MNSTERYSRLRQSFDRRASQYLRNPVTHWVGSSELAALKNMLQTYHQSDQNIALDFGCGTGRVTAMLLEMKFKVTGYDLSPGMLERAQADLGENPNVVFTSDPKAIQSQWPLIVALGVLDYYKDTSPLWDEWKRLLVPGGMLLVTTPNSHSPLAWLYTVFSHFTCQAYATSSENLIPLAESKGFSILELKTVFPQNWWGHTIVLSFQLNQI